VVEHARQIPGTDGYSKAIEGKARLEHMAGRMQHAAGLFGMAWMLREKDNYPLTELERPDYEAAIAGARAAIGDKAFDEAFAKARRCEFQGW
jgi:hypothetical protein